MEDGRHPSDPDATSKMMARIISAAPVFVLASLLIGSAIDALPDWVREGSITIFFASVLMAFFARRPFVSKYVTGAYGGTALRGATGTTAP